MRNFIQIVENTSKITPEALSRVIMALAQQFIEKGLARNLYELNDGLCQDFAYAVVNEFGGEHGKLFTVWAEELTEVDSDGDAAGEAWDVKLIKKISPNSHPTHGLTWEEASQEIPSHCWIMFNGRSYDAECPNGTDNFFELPLIERGMEYMAASKGHRS
jgi:hypothetical protein